MIIRGYKKNRTVKNAELLFSKVLAGESLWQYREEIGNLAGFKKNMAAIAEPWIEGYANSVDAQGTVKLNSEAIAKDNYFEALDHLRSIGIEVDAKEDIFMHAIELINTNSHRQEILALDALEHLHLVRNYQGKKDIEVEQIEYATGGLKEYLFIGYCPTDTCLGLHRINSDCLISMIGQSNTLPFFVYASHNDKKTMLGRSILRIEEDRLVVDDIYGKNLDFIPEVKKFADNLGLKVLIPNRLSYRLTDKDKEFAKSNLLFGDYVKGSTQGLYYSDSLGGRINQPSLVGNTQSH
jgi:hypothetical protein